MSLSLHLTTTTLHLTSIPPGTFIGIDLTSFTSTPAFQGVKLIPSGLHLLYYSTTTDSSLRNGFWFHAYPGRVISKVWDSAAETATLVDAPPSSVGLGERVYAENLAPYRQWEEWGALSGCVREWTLERCLGEGWVCGTAGVSGMDYDVGEEEIMGFPPGGGGVDVVWTNVDLKVTWPAGTIGRERTEMANDRSWALNNLLHKLTPEGQEEDAERELLGELQLSFVMSITLGSYSAMEQYRRLLGLCLTSRNCVFHGRRKLFEGLLETLLAQLDFVDGDFWAGFVDGGDGDDNWLAKLLRRFGSGIKDAGSEQQRLDPGKNSIVRLFRDIESLTRRKFDWVLDHKNVVRRGLVQTEDGEMVELELAGQDEEDETGEYAPVIVEEVPSETVRE
ncbi:AAR2 protein-domain-containing protein [Tuber brumale]|nr:AAR2 protein-domain-containing protein [Tuber brumale]